MHDRNLKICAKQSAIHGPVQQNTVIYSSCRFSANLFEYGFVLSSSETGLSNAVGTVVKLEKNKYVFTVVDHVCWKIKPFKIL